MRILHVTDRLTDRGGAYTDLLAILSRQASRHEVALAVGRDDGHVEPGCPVYIVPGLDGRLRSPIHVDEVLGSFRPDVVHVHNVVNPDALERLGRLASVSRVITVQDHRGFCPGKGKWTERGDVCVEPMSRALCTQCFSDDAYYQEIYRATEERRAALERFRVVTLSKYMKRELTMAGVQPETISVVPPFVDGLDAGAVPSGPPCVLFVGRLVAAKGVLDAVAAWEASAVSEPLVFAGAGPMRAHLGAHETLGWVPRSEMSGVYRRARALIMPSRWQEPFGIAGLEALTMGVPVVAWDSGGVSEWHPGDGLVPWGDIRAMAEALARFNGRAVRAPLTGRSEDALERIYDATTAPSDP